MWSYLPSITGIQHQLIIFQGQISKVNGTQASIYLVFFSSACLSLQVLLIFPAFSWRVSKPWQFFTLTGPCSLLSLLSVFHYLSLSLMRISHLCSFKLIITSFSYNSPRWLFHNFPLSSNFQHFILHHYSQLVTLLHILLRK